MEIQDNGTGSISFVATVSKRKIIKFCVCHYRLIHFLFYKLLPLFYESPPGVSWRIFQTLYITNTPLLIKRYCRTPRRFMRNMGRLMRNMRTYPKRLSIRWPTTFFLLLLSPWRARNLRNAGQWITSGPWHLPRKQSGAGLAGHTLARQNVISGATWERSNLWFQIKRQRDSRNFNSGNGGCDDRLTFMRAARTVTEN